MNRSILLVTKDSTVIAALQAMFVATDYVIEVCDECDVQFKFKISQPQVVILDANKESLQTCRKLKKSNEASDFSVIMLAETMERQLLFKAYKAGMNFYILKQPEYILLGLTLQTIFKLDMGRENVA
jgi:DNA-binding response OmpR family regulator